MKPATELSLLIDAAELARMLSVSKPSVWRWMAEGKLPPPIRITAQCLRWNREAVLTWITAGCHAPTTEGGAA